ncbi:unnamed protein product, partial [Amoebophrya sp. A25]|eukprot:GSA25T00014581001.1
MVVDTPSKNPPTPKCDNGDGDAAAGVEDADGELEFAPQDSCSSTGLKLVRVNGDDFPRDLGDRKKRRKRRQGEKYKEADNHSVATHDNTADNYHGSLGGLGGTITCGPEGQRQRRSQRLRERKETS